MYPSAATPTRPSLRSTVRQAIQGWDWSVRVYAASMALAIASAILGFMVPGSPVPSYVLLVAFHGFLVGFVLWVFAGLPRFWSHPLGRTAVVIAHALALLVSTMLARNQVSTALGLPAQDFDLTVAFLTLLFYLPAWCLVIGATGVIAMIPVLLGAPALSVLERLTTRACLVWVAHVVGSIVLTVYAVEAFSRAAKDHRSLHGPIRWIAVLSDFQPMENYEGRLPGVRYRLHENGVISAALACSGEVIIWQEAHGGKAKKPC